VARVDVELEKPRKLAGRSYQLDFPHQRIEFNKRATLVTVARLNGAFVSLLLRVDEERSKACVFVNGTKCFNGRTNYLDFICRKSDSLEQCDRVQLLIYLFD
jgi:hypothetical protein